MFALHRTFVLSKRDKNISASIENLWLTVDETKMSLEELTNVKEVVLHRQRGKSKIEISYRNSVPCIKTSFHVT